MNLDMDKTRREQIRWVLLLAMNHARPYGANEQVLLATVRGVYQDATDHELRRELEYLDARKLATIEKSPSGPWRGNLTRYGIDMAEYTIDCAPGIGRPEKYW